MSEDLVSRRETANQPVVTAGEVKGSSSCIMLVAGEGRGPAQLQKLLNSRGYRIRRVNTGTEALEAVYKDPPDLVLLDGDLPGIDGCWVVSKLKSDPGTMIIPVVLLCSQDEAGTRIRALEAGADEVLVKPAGWKMLQIRIKSLLRAKAYHDHFRENQEKLQEEIAGKDQEIKNLLSNFARFVPSEFLRCLNARSPRNVQLGDQIQRDMTIMFSDIRSFTALSEKMTPEENFKFLNAYLERMNPFIWNNGGFVDKYIGDAIMALFPKGVETAVNAAVEMLKYIPVYNSHRANFLYPPIRIGIGLHTGPVMLGIIGHSNFMQGTVISDAVNLSARLESLTKRYRVSLIVSEQVIKAMGARAPSHCRYLDTIKVEGKDIPVSIYEIFEADPEFLIRLKLRTRSLFEKGVRLFVANRPAEALDVFNQVWRTGRGDYTVAYYIMRSSYYVKYGIKREKKIGQL